MKPSVVLVALLCAFWLVAPAAQQAASRPFALAVVEWGPDASALQPVARFTGTTWVNSWINSDEQDVAVPPLAGSCANRLAGRAGAPSLDGVVCRWARYEGGQAIVYDASPLAVQPIVEADSGGC